MPVWVSAAVMAVCVISGSYLLRNRKTRHGFLFAAMLLLAGVAFALYSAAAIVFTGAID